MQPQHKTLLSLYAALIFHHFPHTGRTMHQPLNRTGCPAEENGPAATRRAAVTKTQQENPRRENFVEDNQGQKVELRSLKFLIKTQKDPTILEGLNLFDQRPTLHPVLRYVTAPADSLSEPGSRHKSRTRMEPPLQRRTHASTVKSSNDSVWSFQDSQRGTRISEDTM